jgi:hypothetical protein
MLNIVKFDGFMVFNATFNNMSVILWQSVLLVEETGVHRKPLTFSTSSFYLHNITIYQSIVKFSTIIR